MGADSSLELVPGLRITRGSYSTRSILLPSIGPARERRHLVHEAPTGEDELAQVFPHFRDYRMAGRGVLLRSASRMHGCAHAPGSEPSLNTRTLAFSEAHVHANCLHS